MKILAMSGFAPEQICDVVRFRGYPGERNISHYCGYASDFISQVLHDREIDGAVFPRTCDSSRIIKSYLEPSGKFLFQLNVPPYCDAEAAGASTDFFASELRRFRSAVEEHFGVDCGDIAERVTLINRRNAGIRSLYERLDSISFRDYLRAVHAMLALPLDRQRVPELAEDRTGGKRVYLVGSFLSSESVADALESAGLNVVGDDLPESGRLAYTPPVETEGDIYKNIAKSMTGGRLSPTQSGFDSIIRRDVDEIEKKDAQGVIFVTQKYCEPYDFLYPVFKKTLDDMGIPTLRLSLSASDDRRGAKLALEAFADMI